MEVVAVAGGSGDVGRLVVNALNATCRYRVLTLTRHMPPTESSTRICPVTGEQYHGIIQTDYVSQDALAAIFTVHKVKVVICAFIMDNDAASDAQLQLIRSAERCPSVQRFIPSEFNIDYDVSDETLPYPEKRYHIAARRALEKTNTIEFTYIYTGMFMDYFGMPHVTTSLRPLCFFLDPTSGQAVLPEDGAARMSMSFTTDAAQYIALTLEMKQWPPVLTTVTSTISLNELVALAEKTSGQKLKVVYQSMQNLLQHETIDLPTNIKVAEHFPDRYPGGMGQVRALIADLEAAVALGAYDLEKSDEYVHLTAVFQGRISDPHSIEDMVKQAWGRASST